LLAVDRIVAYRAGVDSENPPEATPDEPELPVSTRSAPGPRTSGSRSQPRAGASEDGSADLRRARTTELHPPTRQPDPRVSEPPPEPRPVAAEPTVPTNIYRARRPAVAVFLIIPALAVGFLLVRSLAISAFGKTFLIDGVIASSLGLAALPLLVTGLYGLITGAAHGAEQWGFRVWAKPPLAYLVVGISFVLAAGVAIR
jgi:hypothetical protein